VFKLCVSHSRVVVLIYVLIRRLRFWFTIHMCICRLGVLAKNYQKTIWMLFRARPAQLSVTICLNYILNNILVHGLKCFNSYCVGFFFFFYYLVYFGQLGVVVDCIYCFRQGCAASERSMYPDRRTTLKGHVCEKGFMCMKNSSSIYIQIL